MSICFFETRRSLVSFSSRLLAMSTSNSDSEESHTSNDSDINFIPGFVELEFEVEDVSPASALDEHLEADQDAVVPYSDEPLASKEWIQQYEHEKQQEEAQRQDLQNRLDNVVPVSSW